MIKATKRPAPGKAGKTNGHLNGKVEGSVEGALNGRSEGRPAGPKIATVSHTLESLLAERLREFAFRERISESAVIEHALLAFFSKGDDTTLGAQLRKQGAALRRKT